MSERSGDPNCGDSVSLGLHPSGKSVTFTRKELLVAILLFNITKATDRSAAGFVSACASGKTAAMPVGEDRILQHRGGTAAGETSALVARCVL